MKMHLLLASLLALTILCNTWFRFTEAALPAQCRAGNGSGRIARTMVVGQTGARQFTSVQAAINSVPSGNDQWTRIVINPGIYKEQVEIPRDKPCVFLEGSNRLTTVITYDAHMRTDRSSTFTSLADNIVAKGITFKNSYNRYWIAVPGITQAVAARILGDKTVFLECGFEGVQDTVFDGLGRHYFKSCYIEGAVDFIFGSAQSFYEDCLINATVARPPYYLQHGYITAHGRQWPNELSGFVFERGAVISGREGELFLGRAYGPYSRVIFHKTLLPSNVAPEGWHAWHYQGQEGNLMYSEVGCTGEGAHTSNRVVWEKRLSPWQFRQQYSRSSFIDGEGWLARTPLGGRLLRGF